MGKILSKKKVQFSFYRGKCRKYIRQRPKKKIILIYLGIWRYFEHKKAHDISPRGTWTWFIYSKNRFFFFFSGKIRF